MVRHISAFLLLLSVLLCSCSISQTRSPDERPVTVLAGPQADCLPMNDFGRYYLLFGAFPLNEPAPEELFPLDGRAYRVTEKAEWLDILITVFGGWAVTLTRTTLSVEECKNDVVIASPEEVRREVDQTIARHLRDTTTTADNRRQPIVVMKDGSSMQGRIVEISEEALTLEIHGSAPEDEEEEEPTDALYLSGGRVVYGRISRQDRENVYISTDQRLETISKTEIDRIAYNVRRPRLTVRREEVPRADVERIILKPNQSQINRVDQPELEETSDSEEEEEEEEEEDEEEDEDEDEDDDESSPDSESAIEP